MNNTIFEQIRGQVLRWVETVAELIARIQDSLAAVRNLHLVEQPDHAFVAQTAEGAAPGARYLLQDGALVEESGGSAAGALQGARVSIELLPEHFVFRDLDLPVKASSFIEGVVRAQIDRITPWSASQAAFGLRRAPDADGERIHVTVAATARALMSGYVTAASAAGAHSVVVTTAAPGDETGAPIEVLEQMVEQTRATQVMRGRLLRILAAAGAFAGASAVLVLLAGAYVSSLREGVEGEIATARQALQSGPGAGSASVALHREKAQAPLSTLVLEALTRALPDDVYLSGLEIRGDTLRISGLTPDASKVVGLIERTPTFSRATFAAPTVRSTAQPGELFQIEAHINPVYPALK